MQKKGLPSTMGATMATGDVTALDLGDIGDFGSCGIADIEGVKELRSVL